MEDTSASKMTCPGVAIAKLDFPPVNVMTRDMRAAIVEHVRNAEQDDSIRALVLLGTGSNFVTGADLAEFEAGEIRQPDFRTVLAAVENCRKPVFAVLNGVTLGAGIELALACHFRIAMPKARLGLPEITLGLVPGAGGTQRLPRVVGMENALEMLLSGKTFDANGALELGLVDSVADGDPEAAGCAAAQAWAESSSTPAFVRTKDRPAGHLSDDMVSAALARNARPLKGRTTQHQMVKALKAAESMDFEQGLDEEQALSDASMASRESQALRHMFFAERRSATIPGLAKGALPGSVKTVAVIGAGTMGSGIAMAFTNAGYTVILVDSAQAGLDRGGELIAKAYLADAKRGRITEEQAAAKTAAITRTLDLSAIADVDLVVEAVFEDMALKKTVLANIDKALNPGAVIASNTSSLSVTELAAATSRPDKVVGLHFFSPAHIMRLLEIVRTDLTSPQTLQTALEIAGRIRKIPAVSADGFGFIGNRMMLDGAFREAEQMMLEGASVEQIDDAVEAFGFAMGPSRVNDMAGVDIGTLVREQLAMREARPDPYCIISDTLTPLGRIGQKAGKGFYSYAVDPRKGANDPEVTAIIEKLAAERGIARRAFDDAEIQERFVLQLINVGADILAEKIAYRASDIDVVWVHGYGFPRHLGGPMFHADTLGIPEVLARIRHYLALHGHYWEPSKLLVELAESGKTFSDFDAAI